MASGKAVIGKKAPDFKAEAVVGGDFKTVQLSDYAGALFLGQASAFREFLGAGKYVVLFFYPYDFTFVCPTEIISFSDRAGEFRAINSEVRSQAPLVQTLLNRRPLVGHRVLCRLKVFSP